MFAGLAAIGALVVCGVGLAIALHGKHGISGLGPIAGAMLAALFLTPTAAIAGYLLGRQRAQQQMFDDLAAEAEHDPN